MAPGGLAGVRWDLIEVAVGTVQMFRAGAELVKLPENAGVVGRSAGVGACRAGDMLVVTPMFDRIAPGPPEARDGRRRTDRPTGLDERCILPSKPKRNMMDHALLVLGSCSGEPSRRKTQVPVQNYGVVVGSYNRLDRGGVHQGHWYHGYLYLNLPEDTTNVGALDVYAASNVGVQYRLLYDLDPDLFSLIAGLAPGRHAAASGPVEGPSSGAIDYVRSKLLKPHIGCLLSLFEPILAAVAAFVFALAESAGWQTSDGDNALIALEAELPQAERIWMFGSLFETGPNGPGVHDVHYNQGDPVTSPDGSHHQNGDGVWQDGGVLWRRTDGRLMAWLVKFSSQTLKTNDQTGLPI